LSASQQRGWQSQLKGFYASPCSWIKTIWGYDGRSVPRGIDNQYKASASKQKAKPLLIIKDGMNYHAVFLFMSI